MTPVAGDALALRPEPNRALVMFVRPGRYGGAIQAAVYDGESLVGISSSGTAIPYQAAPGKHLFMVVSEAADFLDADLLAGKTYYVRVVPRMGWWRARFSLQPLDATGQAGEIARWQRATHPVAMNERAAAWDRDNRPSVLHKHEAYLQKWLAKPAAARPALHPEDGF